jgi:hypothetical protein
VARVCLPNARVTGIHHHNYPEEVLMTTPDSTQGSYQPEYCECPQCEFSEPDADLGYLLYTDPDYLNRQDRS